MVGWIYGFYPVVYNDRKCVSLWKL